MATSEFIMDSVRWAFVRTLKRRQADLRTVNLIVSLALEAPDTILGDFMWELVHGMEQIDAYACYINTLRERCKHKWKPNPELRKDTE